MVKAKSLIIGGSVVIGLSLLLFLYLGLVSLGVIHTKSSTLVVQTESLVAEYNGKAHVMNEIKVIDGALFDGHELTAVYNGSQTNVGKSPNYATPIVLDSNEVDVTYLYKIDVLFGEIEVNKINLEITTGESTRPYNGEALDNKTYDITQGQLMKGDYLLLANSSSITLPGEISNNHTYIVKNRNNDIVTNNYEISIIPGELIVEKINLSFTTPSITKVYEEGVPLTNDNEEVIESNNNEYLDGHRPIFTPSSSLTYVGSIPNVVSVKIVDRYNFDVSNYYNVNLTEGYLNYLPSIYTGNTIEHVPIKHNNTDVFTYNTDTKGTVYFRNKSYGNYNTLSNSWTEANSYDELYKNINYNLNLSSFNGSILSPLNITAELLKANGYNQISLEIDPVRKQVPYLTPYYTLNNKDTRDLHNHDPYVYKDLQSYNINYFNQNVFYIYRNLDTSLLPTEYKELESRYSEFVYNNYLSVDSNIQNTIYNLNILKDNFNPTTHDYYVGIKDYIVKMANHTTNFNLSYYAKDRTLIESFLTNKFDTDTQLFASAATLIYRAYGIPARYVTGFINDTSTNSKTIKESNAHAWVEIYIDKIGWVNVEVTPGFGGIPINMGVEYLEKTYDGKPINYDELKYVFDETQLLEGHYLDNVTFKSISQYYNYRRDGYRTEIDQVVIRDQDGNDVTMEYNINKEDGYLDILQRDNRVITSGQEFTYSGNPNMYEYNDAPFMSDLLEGHYIDQVIYNNRITNYGVAPNTVSYIIKDAFGNDVSNNYNAMYSYGNLKVNPKTIRIELINISKVYDGIALTSSEFIVSGTFGYEVITIEVEGSQTEIGVSQNRIISYTITNNNTNISSNYEVITIEGTLKVTPRRN